MGLILSSFSLSCLSGDCGLLPAPRLTNHDHPTSTSITRASAPSRANALKNVGGQPTVSSFFSRIYLFIPLFRPLSILFLSRRFIRSPFRTTQTHPSPHLGILLHITPDMLTSHNNEQLLHALSHIVMMSLKNQVGERVCDHVSRSPWLVL